MGKTRASYDENDLTQIWLNPTMEAALQVSLNTTSKFTRKIEMQ